MIPSERHSSQTPSAATLILLTLPLVVLAGHAAGFLPFMADDSFISLRYAQRLLSGHGLTWNDGETVEGYSNLLWILGCAALSRLGLDLVTAARVLGSLGAAAALGAVLWLFRGTDSRAALPGIVGALAMALSGSLAAWTVGGLEQPLLAGLLAWALVLCLKLVSATSGEFRTLVLPGVLLGFIALTRSDGALFTVAICLGLAVARGLDRKTLKMSAGLAAVPLLFLLGQLIFRLHYYHDWLPNPAYAKLALTGSRIATGLVYVGAGLGWMMGLLVPGLLAPFVSAWDRVRFQRSLFLVAVLVVWLAYVVLIGGDIFPGRRHLVPAVVILALLLALGIEAVLARPLPKAALLWAGASCLVLFGISQAMDPENQRARTERWEWDGKAIGGLLAQAFGAQRPLLAVDPAGCVPYFSRLPSVDMLGLNDKHIARHRPANYGQGVLGHELGDGAYVLSRHPDLVLFNLPTGGHDPNFISGREMVRDPAFRDTYQLVKFESVNTQRVRSLVWARVEGGAIGIQRSGTSVLVPGFLMSWNENSVARLDGEGRIGVVVKRGVPAGIEGLALPSGRWTLRPESSDSQLGIEVARKDGGGLAAGRGSLAFEVPPNTTAVDIGVSTDQDSSHVRALRLDRVGAGSSR